MRKPGFGPSKRKPPTSKRPLLGEDKEMVERALAGEFVDPQELWLINVARAKNKKSAIIPKVKPYSEDKEDLDTLNSHAEETFLARADIQNRILAEIAKPDRDKDIQEFCDMVNYAAAGDPEVVKETNDQLGQWVADYLADNGYNPHLNSLVIKQMILSAFPSITQERQLTPDNITDVLLRSNQVMNEYLAYEKKRKYSWSNTMTIGPQGRFYS